MTKSKDTNEVQNSKLKGQNPKIQINLTFEL